jgi:hypothetical protein
MVYTINPHTHTHANKQTAIQLENSISTHDVLISNSFYYIKNNLQVHSNKNGRKPFFFGKLFGESVLRVIVFEENEQRTRIIAMECGGSKLLMEYLFKLVNCVVALLEIRTQL